MDVWGGDLVSSFADMVESTTGKGHKAPAAAVEGGEEGAAAPAEGGEEKGDKEGKEGDAESPEGGAEAAEAPPPPVQGPELIVEMQCAAETQVGRLMASLGIDPPLLAKAPKDQQAAVKTLETDLAAYTALLLEIPVLPVEEKEGEEKGEVEKKEEGAETEEKEKPAPEFTHSHPAVLDMAANGCRRLLRVRTDVISVAQVSVCVCMCL